MEQKPDEADVNRLKGNPNSQHGDFEESRGDDDPAQPRVGPEGPTPATSIHPKFWVIGSNTKRRVATCGPTTVKVVNCGPAIVSSGNRR